MKSLIKKVTLYISIFLFASLSTIPQTTINGYTEEVKQPQILIINSYHQGYGWTDKQMQSITDYFNHHPENPVYYVEYLDWKRHPESNHIELMASVIIEKYKDIDIDLILTTDDVGMQFAIDYRDQIAKDVPIVFTGVYQESALLRMTGVDNITGVVESIDTYGNIELVLNLVPNTKHLYIINDCTESGKDVEASILKGVEFYQQEKGYTYDLLNDKTYEQIKEILHSPIEDSVVIIGSFSVDSDGTAVPNELFTEDLSSFLTIPMFSPYEFNYGNGIAGGLLLSGSLQGEAGAKIAMKIIGGETTSAIEVKAVDTAYYGLDYRFVEKFNLPYKKLAFDYEMINQPMKTMEQYMTVLFISLFVIAILSIFTFILVFNIRNRIKAQEKLQNKHRELQDTYEILAYSENELKVQNEKLMLQQEEIKFLAYYDKMTKLPNRYAVEDELKKIIGEGDESQTLLMIVDIDNFSYINTAYGHAFADELLKYLSARMSDLFVEGYYVGRISGDEFLVIKRLNDEVNDCKVIERIDAIFENLITIDEKQIHITKSIGYTIYPDDGEEFDELMARTDIAKTMMKRSGKDMTSRFDSSMNNDFVNRKTLAKALKAALRNEEMFLVYQPQFNIFSGEVIGFEALVRWNSETNGDIRPDVFIPLAEEMGEIVEIGDFVFREACGFVKQNENVFDYEFRLSINISVLQLLRQDFIENITNILKEYKVSAEMIEIEITESVLIESFELINARLLQLRELGMTISLDDFGTGYSSLTYLKKLPISTLKIDKHFIDGIIDEGDNHFFSKSIVGIAHELGLRVIAEGVEEQTQVDYLRDCENQIIQGFWFSKPLPGEDAINLYDKHKK